MDYTWTEAKEAECLGRLKKMKLELKHVKNPDIGGGYWDYTADREPGRARKVEVADYAEASKVARAYIEKNGLGCGNWAGGRIFDGGKVIARVSFNGRVWAGEKWVSGAKPLFPPNSV